MSAADGLSVSVVIVVAVADVAGLSWAYVSARVEEDVSVDVCESACNSCTCDADESLVRGSEVVVEVSGGDGEEGAALLSAEMCSGMSVVVGESSVSLRVDKMTSVAGTGLGVVIFAACVRVPVLPGDAHCLDAVVVVCKCNVALFATFVGRSVRSCAFMGSGSE